ncbi:hypothetical protein [Bacillus manliponensis]|nr:hypothetical protein [Bacillus manliponensis]
MSKVLSASRLMTAAQVKEECKRMRNNPTLLLVVEARAKSKLKELNVIVN